MRRLWDLAEAVQECFHPDVIAVVEAPRKDAVHVPGGFRRYPHSWKSQEIVFFDESESNGGAVTEGALTKDTWWHISFVLCRPHYPSFQEMVVTPPDEDIRRGFDISLVPRACVSERGQTATGGKRIVEPCITQACCSCHLSPDFFLR